MKYLRITMPDNSRWDVPCELIAQNRAKYYEGKPNTYSEEYDYTMGSDFELKDWAADNMNWSEVESYAHQVEPEKHMIDFQEGWVNGKKEIIER